MQFIQILFFKLCFQGRCHAEMVMGCMSSQRFAQGNPEAQPVIPRMEPPNFAMLEGSTAGKIMWRVPQRVEMWKNVGR